MRDQFPGHFRLNEEEINALWDKALFVLDANILLNFYRYSDQTTNEFLAILDKIKGRLWIPHRVAEEFLENRITVIVAQTKAYEDSIKSLNKIEQSFSNSRSHPFLSDSKFRRLKVLFRGIIKELQGKQEENIRRISNDPLLDRIDALFKDRVGHPKTSEAIILICEEGKNRYAKKVPPGYSDAVKSETQDPSRPFGDLIIWKEILEKSKSQSCDIILIIDDRKEDWWLKSNEKTIGPRPELIKEFVIETGQQFHMYQADHFLELAGSRHKTKINPETLSELAEVRDNSDEDWLAELVSPKTEGNAFTTADYEKAIREYGFEKHFLETEMNAVRSELNKKWSPTSPEARKQNINLRKKLNELEERYMTATKELALMELFYGLDESK